MPLPPDLVRDLHLTILSLATTSRNAWRGRVIAIVMRDEPPPMTTKCCTSACLGSRKPLRRPDGRGSPMEYRLRRFGEDEVMLADEDSKLAIQRARRSM